MAEVKLPTNDEIESTLALKSNKPNKEYATEKKDKGIKPVVSDSDSVIVRKKKLGNKFRETFIAEDISNVKRFLFTDVIVPAIKETIVSVVNNGIEMIFFGTTTNRKPKVGFGNVTYTSYGNYFNSGRDQTKKQPRQDIHSEGGVDNDLLLGDKGEAELVLDSLKELIDIYGAVTVAEYYEVMGKPTLSSFTDYKYGWVDLTGVTTKRTRFLDDSGRVTIAYYLDLPKPSLLD